MIKVRILDRREFCDGEAYIFLCEDVDSRGDMFDCYLPNLFIWKIVANHQPLCPKQIPPPKQGLMQS